MNLKSAKHLLISVIIGLLCIPVSTSYSQTDITMYLFLQGDNRPFPEGWHIPLTVKFFEPGADVLSNLHLYEFNETTQVSVDPYIGAFCNVSGVAPGTYDITVVSDHTLLNVKRNVPIPHPIWVYMGTLLEGDANNNYRIDLNDFAILASAWLAAENDAGFDSRADFDRNGNIHMPDLELMTSNWLLSAPIEVPWRPAEIIGVCNRVLCEYIEPEQEQATITFTGVSEIHLNTNYFSEYTEVKMFYDGREFDITAHCEIDQRPDPGPWGAYHVVIGFDTFDLPIGPQTWARYTILLNAVPPAPNFSDDIWILTNGPE